MENKKMLVVGAHALDFVWRAAGTIAAYADKGWQVRILDLTYGERGESCELWESSPGITEEEVKQIRRKSAEGAASALGATIEFFDWSDHLLVFDRERVLTLTRILKEYRPEIVVTHFDKDPLNYDHPATAEAVFEAVRCARVAGVFPELPKITLPNILMFDPNQPEFLGFKPDVFIDITDYMDKKVEAMGYAANAQNYLIEAYKDRAIYRGTNARTFSGDKKIRYAEAFQRFAPYVGREFH